MFGFYTYKIQKCGKLRNQIMISHIEFYFFKVMFHYLKSLSKYTKLIYTNQHATNTDVYGHSQQLPPKSVL